MSYFLMSNPNLEIISRILAVEKWHPLIFLHEELKI